MKTNKIIIALLAILVSTGLYAVAKAEAAALTKVDVGLGASVDVNTKNNGIDANMKASTTVKGDMHADNENMDDSDDAGVDADNTSDVDTEGSMQAEGQINAEEHRSAVALFVKSLLSVADRDAGIGAEVRAVAQDQSDSASTSVEAMNKIEHRSQIKKILLGSDYSSLGELRSEIVVTQNNINKLNTLLAKAVSADTKAELSAQIKTLEDSQVKLDTYVKANEGGFSVFGWFVKLFIKSN